MISILKVSSGMVYFAPKLPKVPGFFGYRVREKDAGR